VRELVRVTLASRGYRVLEAENGECGLRVAEGFKEHIDILITDVVMPASAGANWPRSWSCFVRHLRALSFRLHRNAVVAPGALGPARLSAEAVYAAESRKKVREVLRSKPAPKSLATSASN